MESHIQVKVEYGYEKWLNFFVNVGRIFNGEYNFSDLVDDIIQRCSALKHLNACTIRIRYQDDEDSYINLNYGDEEAFRDMWMNARNVADREYKRIRIKACEIDSPCSISVAKDKTSVSGLSPSSVVNNSNKRIAKKPRQLFTDSSKCGDYEELSAERKKRTKIDCCMETVSQAEREVQSLTIDDESSVSPVKTPMDRLLNSLETKIRTLSEDLESKETALTHLNDTIENALSLNDGNLQVCGQCHLREGHTKRNCRMGACPTAKSCGLIEKHPTEKGERRKLQNEIANLRKKLNQAQDNYKMKSTAYAKIRNSFVHKVESDLISTNPKMYVQNGCKNWALINKHAAILEKECKGRLPKKAEIPKLLKRVNMDKSLLESSDSSSTDDESFVSFREGSSSKNRNPAKTSLEQHGVKFPVGTKTESCSEPSLSTSSTVYRCAPSNKQEEQEQLNMVLHQSMLEQQRAITYAAQGSMPIQYIPAPLYYPPTFPLNIPSQTVISCGNLLPATENPFNQVNSNESLLSCQTFPSKSTAVMDDSAEGNPMDNDSDSNSETAAEALLSLMKCSDM